jgi:hypothetical protein
MFKNPPSFLAALAFVLVAGTAGAQTEMTYIVHGIPGQDIGLDPELPVDVSVGGVCLLEDFRFGDVVGPVPVSDPAVDIQVFLADDDGAPGCDGTLVLDLPGVPFGGSASAIIAHLTDDGSRGAGDEQGVGITASKFPLDLSRPRPGRGRVIAQHTARADSVDVDIWRGRWPRNVIEVADFMPGDQVQDDLRPGIWRVRLRAAGTDDVALDPVKLRLRPYRAMVVFAVGTAGTESLDLIGFPASARSRR